MAYNNNIPQATDLIRDSQSQILANFAALSSFGIGYCSMPAQGAAPSFAVGIDGIYTLLYASTAVNEVYIHKQTVDAPTDVPFTASKMSNTAIASCGNGWSYLPSGLLIKWGSVAMTTATLAITPTITSGGPNFNRVFQVMLTSYDTSSAVNFTCGQNTVPNNTSGNFTAFAQNSSATTSINYLVIGV